VFTPGTNACYLNKINKTIRNFYGLLIHICVLKTVPE
jgi:hypothetical protein